MRRELEKRQREREKNRLDGQKIFQTFLDSLYFLFQQHKHWKKEGRKDESWRLQSKK